jgi:hypothetical protein
MTLNSILIIVATILIHFLGCIVYCYLSKDRIGEEEYEGVGKVSHLTPRDIAIKSFFWPVELLLIILLPPIIILSKLIDLWRKK